MSQLGEIESSIEIGVVVVATNTRKGEALARSMSTTTRTSLRSVRGIDVSHDDSFCEGFVGNEVLKLSESPRMKIGSLSFALSSSLSDISQLLHHDSITLLKAINDPTTYDVIQASHPTRFPSSKPFQYSLGGLRVFRLEGPSRSSESLSDIFCLFATEPYSFACCRKVNDSQIDADDLAIWPWLRYLNRGTEEDIDIPRMSPVVIVDSSHFGLLPNQHPYLIVTNAELELLPTMDRRDRHLELSQVFNQSKETPIQRQGSGAEQFWSSPSFGSSLNSPSHAGKDTNDVVGCEAVSFSEYIVEFMVQAVGMRNVFLKGYFEGIITSLGESQHRFSQSLISISINFELTMHGLYKLHHYYYTITEAIESRLAGFLHT